MRTIFDHNVPAPLVNFLPEHEVEIAISLGWEELSDRELLERACLDGYDLLITADQSIRNQQKVDNLPIAIIELSTPNWPGWSVTMNASDRHSHKPPMAQCYKSSSLFSTKRRIDYEEQRHTEGYLYGLRSPSSGAPA